MVDPKPVPLDFDQRHTQWIFQLRIYSHSIVHAHRHGGTPPCTHRAEPRRRVKWRAAGKREAGICGWHAGPWFGLNASGYVQTDTEISQSQPDSALVGITIGYGVLPIIFHLSSLILLRLYKLPQEKT